jgi:hypothetical protein
MTKDKIRKVIDRYQPKLEGLLKSFAWEENAKLAHGLHMCKEIRKFLDDENSEKLDKAFRWLGFLQGVLWCEGIYTITEMASHNRTPQKETSDDSQI